MPNIFSGSSIVFVLSHVMFYVCLTLLAFVGSLVLGNPWYVYQELFIDPNQRDVYHFYLLCDKSYKVSHRHANTDN